MPELPEVETIRRGLEPHVGQQTVQKIIVRESRLRWTVPAQLEKVAKSQRIQQISRRGKYLLLRLDKGALIIHLGMSGRLCIFPEDHPVAKHDHVDFVLSNKRCLRLTDPRRFGAVLWSDGDPLLHPLLSDLWPEPLTDDFNGGYLFKLAQKRTTTVKSFIMDSHIVVGVGNIYAAEALFQAGIHPKRAVNRISQARFKLLASHIKKVLNAAIKQGGTTLRDFLNGDSKPGYFKQKLQVYGRGGLPCMKCATVLREIRLNQRSTVYCPHCQV